jgi:DeoR/GlpR family transcriptional regulator of sugar metabolism
MWSQERHRLIAERLRAQRRIAVDGLAQELGVSRETVRRDLLDLEQAGLLRRVHGGAVLAELKPEEPFARRQQTRRAEKEAIARAALPLLQPGETCFIDAGSTTALLAVELARLSGLMIITNSLDVAQGLRAQRADHQTVLLGGALMADIPGTCGEATMAELQRYSADVAIISPMGIDAQRGATNFLLPEAEIARLMIRQSRRCIMLADHAKLGLVSRVQICGCQDIAVLVTDVGGAEQAAGFTAIGQVVVAES